MVLALLVLVGLTLVDSQTDPNAHDLAATRWIQQLRDRRFVALMYRVSWFGYSPQNFILPLALATPFALRCLWVEALWVLASQAQPWWRWLSMSWCTEPVLRQSWWACSHRCPTRASRAATSCNTPPSSGHVLPGVRAHPTLDPADDGPDTAGAPNYPGWPVATLPGPTLAQQRAGRLRGFGHAANSVLLGVHKVAPDSHPSTIHRRTYAA
jgi:hypothetical protein